MPAIRFAKRAVIQLHKPFCVHVGVRNSADGIIDLPQRTDDFHIQRVGDVATVEAAMFQPE
jgi:hypothetical protein